MEFDTTEYKAKYVEFVRAHDGFGAPFPIAFGLARMSGSELPIATSITVDTDDQTETWRAMWLLESSIVYLAGSKPAGTWQTDNTGPVAGWVRKLSDLTAITVVDQQAINDFGDIRVEAVSALEFRDVTEAVPVNNGVRTSFAAADKFVEAVRGAWLAS